MTDIERIRQIEERLGYSLPEIPIEKFKEKERWGENRGYTLSVDGKVIALGLDCIPQFLLIDTDFSGFENLQFLSWNHGNLRNVSFLSDVPFLKELKGLTWLYLGWNNLSEVSFLKELKELTIVHLSNNKIKEVPVWMAEMNLEIITENAYYYLCINLTHNPIEIPEMSIVSMGKEEILRFYKALDEQE